MASSGTSVGLLARVAWRNLWRHKRRSLITATAMAVALSMCMGMLAINDGAYSTMFRLMVEQSIGHAQVHHPDYPTSHVLYDTLKDVPELLATLDAVDGTVGAAPRLNGFALIGGASDSAGGQIVGVDPARERVVARIADQVRTGDFLGDAPAHEVLVGVGLAEDLELGLGDEVVVVTQASDGSMANDLYTVRGIVRSGATQLDKTGVWMHIADLQELLVLPDQAHGIRLLTTDAEVVADYTERVREAVANDERAVLPWWEVSPQTAQLMDMRDAGMIIILGIIFIMAAFGIVNTMLMSVFERTRELGVLKAIGLRPARMVLLIVFESLYLAGLAGVIGLVLGGLLDWWAVAVGIDYSDTSGEGMSFAGITLDPQLKGEVRASGILIPFVSLFVVSFLASLWPAARAARLRPVEAIRTE